MYMGSDLFQSDDYDSRGDVATKYENHLPVDDLLAPMFSYERVNSFFFFTFRTVSQICDYIRSIQKTETSNFFLLFYLFFSCPPSGNFRTIIPEMYREGSPIGWTIREFVLQVEISTILSELPYARRGDDNLHRIVLSLRGKHLAVRTVESYRPSSTRALQYIPSSQA